MPVSDPKKILKTRGSLKPTTAVYRLEYPQPNTKSFVEPSNSHNPLPETINPTLTLSEVKSEIHPTTFGVHKGKNPVVKLSEIDIPPTLQLDFMNSLSLEEYTIYLDSTPAGSPDYISCKSEEPSPRISFYPSSLFSSLEEARNSLLVFQNPLYNTPFPYPVVLMAGLWRMRWSGSRRRSGGPSASPTSQSFHKSSCEICAFGPAHPSPRPSSKLHKKIT
jgi:hypothetical protein